MRDSYETEHGTSWGQAQKLTASDAEMDDEFGFSVSVSGETVVVGAQRGHCAAGNDCISAYMFRCFPPETIPAVPTWGIVLMGLLMLTAARLVYMRRERRLGT